MRQPSLRCGSVGSCLEGLNGRAGAATAADFHFLQKGEAGANAAVTPSLVALQLQKHPGGGGLLRCAQEVRHAELFQRFFSSDASRTADYLMDEDDFM